MPVTQGAGMAELLIISGPGEGKVVTLGERCVIGRHGDCDLHVPDDTISRRHAVIIREEDGYYIEDLGSSNGTFVNGSPVSRVKLSHRDTIKLSHTVLSFRDRTETGETKVAVVDSPPTHDSTIISTEEAISALMQDSTAIESVDELQDLHQKLLTVTRFSEAVRSTLDLKTLLKRAISLMFEIFPQTERGFVMLTDDEGLLKPMASQSKFGEGEITVSSTVLDTIVRQKKAILSNNPIADTRFVSGQSIVKGGMRSLMAAPLLSGDEVIGAIHIDTTRPGAPFSSDDLALFGGLADQAAVAVANARLHDNLLKRQRLEQELSIAQTVQRSFLPRQLPCHERVDIAWHYALAYKVGGDFYDLIELDDGTLALSIGDVSGKGIPAALLMAKTISEMRIFAHSEKSPAEMLKVVNSTMLGAISPGMFVTAVGCFVDPVTGQATMSDAGHNPPLLKRASGKAEFLELEKGFPLGVVDEGQYANSRIQLGSKDTLLFYTDGITDAANASDVAFGPARLVEAVSAARPGAKSVVDVVLAAVGDFVGVTRPFDDITMIAISPK